jgi:hypothetical protein
MRHKTTQSYSNFGLAGALLGSEPVWD